MINHEDTNPRHPHTFKIIRAELDDRNNPKTDDEGNEIMDIVFESECGMRPLTRGVDIDSSVVKTDYLLSMPKHDFLIKRGDHVEFTNNINGDTKTGKVEEFRVNNLGAKLWFNQKGNG